MLTSIRQKHILMTSRSIIRVCFMSSKADKPKKSEGSGMSKKNADRKDSKSEIEWMLKFFDASQRSQRFRIVHFIYLLIVE